MLRRRRSLLWLLAPYALYLVALPVVDRIDPVVISLPLFTFWMLVAALLTPLLIWLRSGAGLSSRWPARLPVEGQRELVEPNQVAMPSEEAAS
jgi:hypothetical protein